VAIAAARERCARELKELGYGAVERPFTYSALPGHFAVPLFGIAGAMLVGLAGSWAIGGLRYAPAAILVGGGLALIAIARWTTRRGVLAIPLMRAQGVNLEATKPGESPTVWLCAHVDSKSQPLPTLVRSAGLVMEAFGFLLATSISLVEATQGAGVPDFFWAFAGIVTLVGAVPVGLSMVGTQSPGALDNASGVAAVLAAARRLKDQRGVGVLITDAEELGLAGARAWSEGRAHTTVLNCDGVDDAGEITVMRAGRASPRIGQALQAGANAVAIGPHFPGVLTDAVAFADAGLEAVTISRGSMRSFLRVHSRRDNLAHLRGDGIEPTAEFIAASAHTLLTEGH
jgi:hypothetical protein